MSRNIRITLTIVALALVGGLIYAVYPKVHLGSSTPAPQQPGVSSYIGLVVYDSSGSRVGKVVSIRGNMVQIHTWRYFLASQVRSVSMSAVSKRDKGLHLSIAKAEFLKRKTE